MLGNAEKRTNYTSDGNNGRNTVACGCGNAGECWQARDVVMAAAESGQSTLTFGRTENIGIFVLSDPSARQALRDAGAWIILPASAFRGCLVEPFGQTVRTARESLPS